MKMLPDCRFAACIPLTTAAVCVKRILVVTVAAASASSNSEGRLGSNNVLQQVATFASPQCQATCVPFEIPNIEPVLERSSSSEPV